MSSKPDRIAIVGASAAGLAVATALRDESYDGEIVLIGAESELPYDRPPLSKRRLEAETALTAIALVEQAALDELRLDLRLGTPAAALDPAAGSLTLANGETIRWTACVIATGARPVAIPGADFTFRTLSDALRFNDALARLESMVIVGAGVLGCELAAMARTAGVAVTVVDLQQGPMLDRLGDRVSGQLEELHRARGVQFCLGVGVAEIRGCEGRREIELQDGSRLWANAVVAAIGCRPSVDWLDGSGVPLRNGVLCDQFCRALPQVYAAGDVANWYNPRYGRHMRIEHRTNASEQGMAVAANLLGAEEVFDPIPFFWTDQYDAKLQVHGLIGADCDTDLLLEEEGGLVVAYSRNDKVEGCLGWNRAGVVRRARSLIGQPRAVLEAFGR